MHTRSLPSFSNGLTVGRNGLMIGLLLFAGCNDDLSEATDTDSDTSSTGDGDGDMGSESNSNSAGDGDGDGEPGDGDGTPGDGDGDGSGDGDGDGGPGDGDGDGDGSGDGDGDGGPGDGDGDGGPGDGDGGPGDGDGDGDGDGVCSDGCGTPNCGDCPPGPAPVDVGPFSIDPTEVTNEQYQGFLDANVSIAWIAGMEPTCAFKQDWTPDEWPQNNANFPVVNVDWCDATAYCAWAGKRLCGQVNGGPAPLNSVEDWTVNEWYRACTQGGIKNYPYGVNYQGNACNTVDSGVNGRVTVGSMNSCQGGYPGVFDMSGNVWEWTNSCDQQDCRQRGGSYFSDGPTSRCGIDSVRARDHRNINLGFRCCGPG